jgi:AcrR family transcriptional regulator
VEVFHDKGFDGASMEDLAKHLGISKSAIYHHVTSKDELLGLALNRALDALDRVVQDNRTLAGGPRERLEHLLRASVAVLFAERAYVALLLRVRGNTEVERAAMARRREFDTYVAGLVQEAVAEGLVAPDLDPRIAARLLFGLVNSLTEWVRPGSDPAVVADTLVSIAFQGLFAPPLAQPSTPGIVRAHR